MMPAVEMQRDMTPFTELPEPSAVAKRINVTAMPWLAADDWARIAPIEISHFHPAGTDHRPTTRVRIAHDGSTIFLRYDVADRYLLSRQTEDQKHVYKDSCVEFFIWPAAAVGYFNFEFNAGGTRFCHFIEDATRIPGGFVKHRPMAIDDIQRVQVRSSLPRVVEPEIESPTAWWFEATIPVSVLEPYVGTIGQLSGQAFRAGFFKCADESSHPHWGSWAPMGDELNFHQPNRFGTLRFE